MTELMNAFPAPPEGQVTLANWRTSPFNHWAFHHVREIVPSAEIANAPEAALPLPAGEALEMPEGYDAFLSDTGVDALVVLHKGRLVHETYRNGMGPHDPHILMSVSKSMLGLLAGVLVGRGVLDVDRAVEHYLPELEGSGFEGATIRQLLDMRVGVEFNEDYEVTSGPIIQYRKSTLWNPLEPGEVAMDLRTFLASLKDRDGPHGGPFGYKSPCTDLLGWVIERAAGRRYADLFSELIFQPMGAERPGYITVDRFGAPRCAGGMCMTARDLARIGHLVAERGAGIVPEAWIDDIMTGGDPEAWAKGNFAADFGPEEMHYRAKWYVYRTRGPVLYCVGIHGQNLAVDPANGIVLARFGSLPTAAAMPSDLATVELFEQIRARLT